MDQASRIIDLYGLPGCGKTTLSSIILSNSKLQAANIKLLMVRFHSENFVVRLYSVPLLLWARLSVYFLLSGFFKKNSTDILKTYYYLALAYRYFRNQHHFRYLIVDHGMIQQFGSMLHNYDYSTSERKMNKFFHIITSGKNIVYSYCELSVESSLQRMKNRNRTNGRIDSVMNDFDVAIDLLNKEKSLFDSMCKKIGKSGVKLNMKEETKKVADNLLNALLLVE